MYLAKYKPIAIIDHILSWGVNVFKVHVCHVSRLRAHALLSLFACLIPCVREGDLVRALNLSVPTE